MLAMLALELKCATRSELMSTSIGITTSDPNAKLNSVSLVPEWTVVQMAYRVLDNSSTHNLLALSIIFLMDVNMFLFVASVYPLV